VNLGFFSRAPISAFQGLLWLAFMAGSARLTQAKNDCPTRWEVLAAKFFNRQPAPFGATSPRAPHIEQIDAEGMPHTGNAFNPQPGARNFGQSQVAFMRDADFAKTFELDDVEVGHFVRMKNGGKNENWLVTHIGIGEDGRKTFEFASLTHARVIRTTQTELEAVRAGSVRSRKWVGHINEKGEKPVSKLVAPGGLSPAAALLQKYQRTDPDTLAVIAENLESVGLPALSPATLDQLYVYRYTSPHRVETGVISGNARSSVSVRESRQMNVTYLRSPEGQTVFGYARSLALRARDLGPTLNLGFAPPVGYKGEPGRKLFRIPLRTLLESGARIYHDLTTLDRGIGAVIVPMPPGTASYPIEVIPDP